MQRLPKTILIALVMLSAVTLFSSMAFAQAKGAGSGGTSSPPKGLAIQGSAPGTKVQAKTLVIKGIDFRKTDSFKGSDAALEVVLLVGKGDEPSKACFEEVRCNDGELATVKAAHPFLCQVFQAEEAQRIDLAEIPGIQAAITVKVKPCIIEAVFGENSDPDDFNIALQQIGEFFPEPEDGPYFIVDGTVFAVQKN